MSEEKEKVFTEGVENTALSKEKEDMFNPFGKL